MIISVLLNICFQIFIVMSSTALNKQTNKQKALYGSTNVSIYLRETLSSEIAGPKDAHF